MTRIIDAGMKARAQRLAAGDVRNEDLTRLFLYVRDRCDGRQSVEEVGDFVAHHTERTKGIITREVRDWYLTTDFMLGAISTGRDASRLPASFPEFLRASARRISGQIIMREAGLRHAETRSMLPQIIGKLVTNADGTLAIPSSLSATEARLITCLTSFIVSRPAFDGRRLSADFGATLRRLGLLENRQVEKFNVGGPAVILFAVTVMHNCVVQLGDGKISKLQASIVDGEISVNAPVPVDRVNPTGTVQISSAIFSTGLKGPDHCAPSLTRDNGTWASDLELGPDLRLVPLG